MPKSPLHTISTPVPELQGIATIAAPAPDASMREKVAQAADAAAWEAWPSAHDFPERDAFRNGFLAALAQPQPIAGEVYRQGLEDVANPLAYLKRKAEAQGHQLSSMAYTIAHDSNTLREIARDALKAGMRCVNHPDRTVREVLDGEALCQECCDAWVRSEGEAARYEEQERTPASPPSDLSPSPTHDALFDEPRSGEEGL